MAYSLILLIREVSFLNISFIKTQRLTDNGGRAFTFAMATSLLMAYLAELSGLHLIIGAFLAGQFVRKEIIENNVYNVILYRLFRISYGFLVPACLQKKKPSAGCGMSLP